MTSSPAAKPSWLKSSLQFPAPTGPRGRSSGLKWRVRRSKSELWSTTEVESALVGSSGGALVRKDLVFEPLSEDSKSFCCQKLLEFIDSLGLVSSESGELEQGLMIGLVRSGRSCFLV
ncbi:uncharacterized protein LOC112179534 [Rosa chinensis]|uniref:uncharacterized protein LOC112179534 n=1 Tax=Rosa chinensis TaxID=74649 RepID=UPI001AD8A2A5|nr:uncharacterized protein LOC112179534 [Rosa chinensis]